MFDQKILQQLRGAIEKAIEETAVAVQEGARELVPVDTGNLQQSIQIEKIGEFEVRVSANTEYALNVHEGHATKNGGFVQGTPYLLKPLQDEEKNLAQRVKNNL